MPASVRRAAVSAGRPESVTSTSTRSRPQIRAKARYHLGGVGDHDDAAGPFGEQTADAYLVLLMRHQPQLRVHAVDSEDRDIEDDLVEDAHGERSDELVRLGAGDAAGDHDLHLGAYREFAYDVEGVGDDREHGPRRLGRVAAPASLAAAARPEGQGAGHLGGGGAAVEAHHVAVGDHPGDGGGDALLLRGVAGGLVAQGQFVGDAVRDGAAAGADEHLLLGELVEVAADGGRGDAECGGRVVDLDPALSLPAVPAACSTDRAWTCVGLPRASVLRSAHGKGRAGPRWPRESLCATVLGT